ncbi:MAG: Serine/threonine-protein kinase PknD [Mycoplasmataceae bacterium]|nr:Serine/threonine-protein kinase PknD [Mycoplasmataceae bacterium]WNE40853.1 MAG: Serine/threonine-protein kinase PknD [Mycoplasmataceae bacterium]
MTTTQEWLENKFSKDVAEIESSRRDELKGDLIIESYSNLKILNLTNSKNKGKEKDIEKLILKDLLSLEECFIKDCKIKELIIDSCPNIKTLHVQKNNLNSLEFLEKLTNLEDLNIDNNKELSFNCGLKYLPLNLNKFTYKGTKLEIILKDNWKENRSELIKSVTENPRLFWDLTLKYNHLKIELDSALKKENFEPKMIVDPTDKIVTNFKNSAQDLIEENEDLRSQFSSQKPILGKEIGRGSFGKAYKGIWKEQEVAVKEFFKWDKKLKEEIKLLRDLKSKYIIQYYGEYQGNSNNDKKLLIIMEFAERGSLANYIDKNKNESHNWQLNYKFIRQMVKGLRYLHAEGVLHRDLKSHNVLVTEGDVAKLADFGIAQLIKKPNTNSDNKEIVGSIPWMAPESLRDGQYTYQSDIYSLGMIFWEIVARKTIPFKELNEKNTIGFNVAYLKKKEIIPADAPEELTDIINSCWKDNPQERISLVEIESQVNEVIRLEKEFPQTEAKVEVMTK